MPHGNLGKENKLGTPYSTQLQSGYNGAPVPSDDGTQVASNQVKWATIRTKLTDVVLTLAQAINTALLTALDTSMTAKSANYTTAASDHLKPIECTNSITISLLTAASAPSGYEVPVINSGSGTVTVGLQTNTDTLNGTVNGTKILAPGGSATFGKNQAGTGYRIVSGSGVSFADAEAPSGTKNSSNLNFTLAHTPSPAASLQLDWNGLILLAGTDFTLSGAAITMASGNAPGATDTFQAWYRY